MSHEFEHLNPGSADAIKKGCCCPILDNGHGKGAMGGARQGNEQQPLFWVNVACPLHGLGLKTSEEEDQG